MKQLLRMYLQWPLFLAPFIALMSVGVYLIDKKAGIFTSFCVILYTMAAGAIYVYHKKYIQADLVHYAAGYGKVQKQLLKEMVVPYGVLDMEGRLLWANDELLGLLADEKAAKKGIFNVVPEMSPRCLPTSEQDEEMHVTLDGRNYRVVMRRVVLENSAMQEATKRYERDLEKLGDSNQALVSIYFYDETDMIACIKENKDQKMVIGLLYIDNYEEVLESVDEVRQSLLMALVERKINKYMLDIDAIAKKIEKDKYIFVFRHKYLAQLQSDKFSILEDVRTVNLGNDISVTVSIGLGADGNCYSQNYDYARAAIDLALGRGGDQVVVKERDRISYYGGKSVQIEKNTRVKARVKAHALKELMEGKEKVVVMGHSLVDVDSFGAAIGVYRIAKSLDKKAYIVINDITTSVRPVMERFLNNPDYEEDMFVTGAKAQEIVNNRTLLVVVDVNRPSYTECKELLHLTNTIVVLDHHRRTDEGIEHAVLSYIEPYASSACEMVAEILQYIGNDVKLKQVEADAMYSGIMIDTNNFLTKTGVRTFEAAAYLRRQGADVTRIRKGFRSEMMEYKIRAESIQLTEIYLDSYAISQCNGKGVDSPTILGAQVANELLDIQGVKASFVLTEFKEKIYVSARSIDEVNVQIIMEKLGGGGHMSMAGAQLTDCTIEEGREIIRNLLKTMQEEGEI